MTRLTTFHVLDFLYYIIQKTKQKNRRVTAKNKLPSSLPNADYDLHKILTENICTNRTDAQFKKGAGVGGETALMQLLTCVVDRFNFLPRYDTLRRL